MDISDGLSGDLNHILKASRVGARLDVESIPRNKGASLDQALNDGEDFELLFTLSVKKSKSLMDWQAKNMSFPRERESRTNNLNFFPIGTITANVNERIKSKSFSHFKQ